MKKFQNFYCSKKNLEEEYYHKRKNNLIDWENLNVPKEKHFYFDKKKHRIVFQRKHLKVIYSIVDLAYPFNFNQYFNMIKEHIGDKTNQNYGKWKSYRYFINGKKTKNKIQNC